jgi:hypothetical protein
MKNNPIFGSWEEVWIVVVNLVGLVGLLAAIIYGLPLVYALVSR